ncbi:hypothetical protein ABVC94_22380, partial [Xanthomonas euvesicatoria]
EQVSTTVMQLDEMTQQNAALVEEATAAARSMEDQAADLTRAVGGGGGGGGGGGAPPPPPAAHFDRLRIGRKRRGQSGATQRKGDGGGQCQALATIDECG